ncbi:unnamed protein product [Rhizophagus irregularis]|nr:unnamed protein product [Rhizophagus irregularis]
MVRPKVLVVEDNAVNRTILTTFLKKRGIRFDEAENGAIGLEHTNERVATAEIRKIEDEQQSEIFIIIDSNNNNKFNTR